MSEGRYEREVRKIFDLQFFGIKLGLVNIRNLLSDVGDPQDSFRSILVAGTNGKGSVASTLAKILDEAGIRCGLFTSPHLIRFNERFVVNGERISDDELLSHADLLWRYVDKRHRAQNADGPLPITFFEFATALACMHFKQAGCEIVVFECGLGGRLDATNSLEPILDVITPISYDHMQYLGNTLTSIATEKAGILRAGVPAVIARQEEEALVALYAKFQEKQSPSFVFGRDYGIRRDGEESRYWDARGEIGPIATALKGSFQIENASVAIAGARVLQQLGLAIDDGHILSAPTKVRWPGRMETVAEDPEVILDGAHNVHAALNLAKTLAEFHVDGPTVGVFAAMADKDVEGMMRGFAPAFNAAVATAPSMPRSLQPEKLALIARQFIANVETAPDFPAALEKAKSLAGPKGRVVVCGSLFLVGEARAFLLGRKGQGPDGQWIGIRG